MRTLLDEIDTNGLFEKVGACFDGATYVSFATLEHETGVSISDLILHKAELERRFRKEDPDLRLISRMDLDPPGWHLAD